MGRIYRRRPPHWLTLVVVVAILAFARFYWSRNGAALPPATVDSHQSQIDPRESTTTLDEPPRLTEGGYDVERVVDGDTLIMHVPASELPPDGSITSTRVRVRLLGVDAPESVKPDHPVERFGPAASQFTKRFLADGKAELQFGRRRVDDYGRMLAFVFVGNKMLNEELVRAGLARATTFAGDESPQMTRIRKAQKEAKAANRGIWSKP